MRRRPDSRHVLSPAELVHAAAAAGIDAMTSGHRRAWLSERGWTSLDYYRALLAERRRGQYANGAAGDRP